MRDNQEGLSRPYRPSTLITKLLVYQGNPLGQISTGSLFDQTHHLRQFLLRISFTSQNKSFIRIHLLYKHGGQFRPNYPIAFLDGILQTQRAVCCRSLPFCHARTREVVFSFEDCSNTELTADTFSFLINVLHK